MAQKALLFDGTDDYITVSDHASMNWSTQVSCFAWIKPSDLIAGALVIASKYSYSDNKREWNIHQKLSGKLAVEFGDPNNGTFEGRWVTDNVVLATNTWAFIGFTFNAGTVKIYVDGSEVTSSLDTGAIPNSLRNDTADLIIGAYADHSSGWKGIIDEIIITDDVISPAEVTTSWNSGDGAVWEPDGNTVVLFHLDDETSPTDDASANGNDGTVTGASWVDGFPLVVAPTVTHQATTPIQSIWATGNANITDTGGENCTKRGIAWSTTSRGDPGALSPAVSDYENYVEETGSFGTGAFTRNLTGLPTGTVIYTRAYAYNPTGGYNWSGQLSFLTKPSAPTNVAATDGSQTSKVVVTWTKSTGATGYRVYRDAVDVSGLLGDVATYDDTGADAGVITPGTASASDGTSVDHVTLSLAGESVANGTTHTYKVVAVNATGDSSNSITNTGYRGVGALTYQWQRSAADSDASYSNIAGATTDPYNDTSAPANGAGRYFQCVLSATGTSNQTSTANRGYRGWTQAVGAGAIAISGSLVSVIKFFQSVGEGAIAISGSLGRLIKLGVGAGSVAIAGALTAAITFFQSVGSGSVAIVGSLNRLIKLSVGGGAIAIAGAVNRLIKIGVGAGSVAIAGALNRLIKLGVGSGSIAIAGSLSTVLTIFQTVGDGAVAISGALGRLIKLGVGAGSIAITGSLSTILRFIQAVGGGSVAISGTLARLIKIGVGAGSIAITGALGRLIKLSVGAGAIAIAGALSPILTIFQSVGSGSVAIAGSLNRLIKLSVGAGSIAIVGSLSTLRTIFQTVGSGAIAVAGSLSTILRYVQAVGGGSIAISGSLNRLIKIGVGAGSIAITGSLATTLTIFQTVGAGSVAIAGTLNRLIKLSVGAGSIAIAGTLNRLIKLSVGGGSIAIAGSLSTIKRFVQAVGGGSIAISGLLSFTVKRLRTLVNFAGRVLKAFTGRDLSDDNDEWRHLK